MRGHGPAKGGHSGGFTYPLTLRGSVRRFRSFHSCQRLRSNLFACGKKRFQCQKNLRVKKKGGECLPDRHKSMKPIIGLNITKGWNQRTLYDRPVSYGKQSMSWYTGLAPGDYDRSQ